MRGAVECYTDKGEKRCLKKELPFHWLVPFSTDFRETTENEKASKIYFFLLFSFNSIFFEAPAVVPSYIFFLTIACMSEGVSGEDIAVRFTSVFISDPFLARKCHVNS